ncbi:MAG: hypothetical protein QM767_17825 [Anaeromyxobacter sp.]
MKTAHAAVLALTALLTSGCAADFVPGSVLSDLRVLALAPEAPTAAPGETITVTPTVFAPAGDALTGARWTFCPLTSGSTSGYACVSPLCDFDLTPPAGTDPAAPVSADPSALALQCLELLGGTLDGSPSLPEQVETVFRYEVTSALHPSPRLAVARVPLYTGTPPADRNTAPAITGVTVGGAPATPGAVVATAAPGDAVPIEVAIDPASYQTYQDASGRTITEAVIVEFYTSAGRFPDGEDKDDAQVSSTQLELRELAAEDLEAQLWVVARDLRGGQAVAGPFRVTIQR